MNSYFSKNPVCSRSGRYITINNYSTPKLICYTLPKTERSFDFQKPRNNNKELRGNMSKRATPPELKEEAM